MENWENPSMWGERLLDAHPCFRVDWVSLGGKWRFFSQSADLSVPEGWTEGDFNDKHWGRIAVPCSWESAEICPPGALTDAVCGDGAQIDQCKNLMGLYRRSFILSRDQGNRQIILRFRRISSCALVWVNGTYVGMTKGNGESEFDITSAVQTEKNTVCVQVLRYSDASFAGGLKTPACSGILGDVLLAALPDRRITDIQTSVLWLGDGTPSLNIRLKARNAEGFTARIALMDGNQVVGYRESHIEDGAASALLSPDAPKLWSGETPNQYRVAVILWDGVAVYHTQELSLGFCRVALEDGSVLVNGKKETLFAVPFQAVDPENGCYLSAEAMETALKSLKSAHINGISLTGPAPDELFTLCDNLGLYVLWTAGTQPEELSQRLALTHGNHPSILAWDLGEGDSRLNLGNVHRLERDSLSSETKLEADPSPVLLECGTLTDLNRELVRLLRTQPRLMGVVFGDSQGASSPNVAALLQPITVEAQDGAYVVENHMLFRSAADFPCKATLTRDGETVTIRELAVNAAPGETVRLSIDMKYDIYKPGRYYLSLAFQNPADGATFAAGQWPVAKLRHIYDENPGGTIREEGGILYLRAQNVTYAISRATGALEQIQVEDRPVLAAPMGMEFSRPSPAPAGLHLPNEWEKLAGRKKKLKPTVLEVDQMTRTVTASYRLGSGLMETFRLFADGSMGVELRLRTGKTAPDRLGFSLMMPERANLFRWFGLGPEDANPDENPGLSYAIHHQDAQAGSRSGYKEPVYELDLTNAKGFGLHIRSEEGLRASVHPSPEGAVELVLEHPEQSMKPHATYTFGFTIYPVG